MVIRFVIFSCEQILGANNQHFLINIFSVDKLLMKLCSVFRYGATEDQTKWKLGGLTKLPDEIRLEAMACLYEAREFQYGHYGEATVITGANAFADIKPAFW